MALGSPFVVRTEEKPKSSICETMSGMRVWLDHHKVRTVSFAPVPTIDGRIGFDIGFCTEDDAFLFASEFA